MDFGSLSGGAAQIVILRPHYNDPLTGGGAFVEYKLPLDTAVGLSIANETLEITPSIRAKDLTIYHKSLFTS